ncbi:hypothetical protein GWK47_054235 [Chionoecetes opilio]|uniref:Uncharacterized protein n=1 Tax=Chionoecetes opilio TaxID=41210 RepID=A0A8J4Y9X4_CHIOP|nr:hypothetical protein GWK47_054235 [Chionoecetes opilio]
MKLVELTWTSLSSQPSTTRQNRMLTRYQNQPRVHGSIYEDPPKYAALHWDGKMLRDSWEVILGPHQRLWLCLSQDHLHILKASYWEYQ